jgi:hypothetical protein
VSGGHAPLTLGAEAYELLYLGLMRIVSRPTVLQRQQLCVPNVVSKETLRRCDGEKIRSDVQRRK